MLAAAQRATNAKQAERHHDVNFEPDGYVGCRRIFWAESYLRPSREQELPLLPIHRCTLTSENKS